MYEPVGGLSRGDRDLSRRALSGETGRARHHLLRSAVNAPRPRAVQAVVVTKATIVRLSLLLAALFALASGARAQGTGLVLASQSPRTGRHALAAGFTPTPFSIAVQAGGSVAVEPLHLGPGCRGLVDRQPDYIVDWTGRTTQLRFFVRSAADLTLVVQDPAGRFRCNDDVTPGSELSPMVDVFMAPAGAYAVWIGTKTPGAVAAHLFVTEDRAVRP
jgi:hypothetical protein